MFNIREELDFNLELSGSGYKWEVAHFPRYTFPWTREIAEQIKQQILNDYEKARTFDSLELEKDVLQKVKENEQNQKLRELIEKRIEEVEPYTDISLPERKDVTIYNELQKLLEESKK